MELFKLLPSTYLPGPTLQLYDTLVWTERYLTPGDFKLVVKNDITARTLFPIGTLLSHTDTTEVMIVENHEAERDKDKNLIFTISGRSLETFAEQRPTNGTATSALYNANPGGAAIVESYTNPAETVAKTILDKALTPSLVTNADDAIPNFAVSTVLRATDSSLVHVIERGDVYSAVIKLLRIGNAGIKTARPNGAQTTLNFIIHDGLDLTSGASAVTFYAQYEDLDDAKYFWSNRNKSEYAQINTHFSFRLYRNRDIVGAVPTGLDRRITYVEANDLEGAFSPPLTTDSVAARAQSVVDGRKDISLLQAKVSTKAKPRFKVNYNIGDVVTLFGEFSQSVAVRVTEHILTVDDKGQRGYPSLSAI